MIQRGGGDVDGGLAAATLRVKSSLLCVGKIGFLDFHNFKFSFTPRGGVVKEEEVFFFIKSFDERHQRVSMIIK